MDTSLFRKTDNKIPAAPSFAPYGLAVLATGLALALTLGVAPSLEKAPFPLFFGAVLVSAWTGGRGPGWLATLLSALSAEYFVIVPRFLHVSEAREAMPLLAFLIISTATTWLISTLRQTSAHLKEKEEQLTHFVENAMVGLYWMAQDGRIIWANKAELAMLGYAPEEFIGQPIKKFHADPPVADDMLARLAGKEPLHNYEVRLRAKDGSIKTVLLHASTFFRQGRFVHTRCFTRDITEQKRAEASLCESEARTRLIIDTALDAVITTNADDIITSWSRQAELMFGWPRRQVIGKSLGETILPREHREAHERGLKTFLAHGDGKPLYRRFEATARRHDGQEFPAELSIASVNTGRTLSFSAFIRDLTEPKAAEKALKEHEAKFRVIFEKSLDAIGVSKAGAHVFVNPAYVKLFGYNHADELLGQPIYPLQAEDQRPMIQSFVQRRARGEAVPSHYETRGLRKNGTAFDMEVDVSTFELNGEHHTLVILRDITTRKQSELDYKARARQQEVVAQLGQQALATSDMSGLVNAAIRAVQQTLEVEDAKILDLLPAGQALVLQAGWNGREARNAEYGMRTENGRAGGSPLPHSAFRASHSKEPLATEDPGTSDAPFFGENDTIGGAEVAIRSNETVFGVLGLRGGPHRTFTRKDVHFLQSVGNVLAAAFQRRQAEDALREREFLLRRVLDTNPNIIFVKDQDARILLANEALAAAYESPLDTVIGRSHRELHHELGMSVTEVSEWIANDREVIKTGRPRNFVEAFTHRDGSIHWYRTRKLPLSLAADHRCVLIISADITEHKKADDDIKQLTLELEQRVVQRTAQLEEANKELEAFSYSVSHDLRSPLRAIHGFAQMIQDDHTGQLDAEGLRLFEVICSNSRRMGQLIDDLLAFSKLSRADFVKSAVDMAHLTRAVLSDLSLLAPQPTKIILHELPTAPGDAALLRQVFTNLISNAVKFSRHARPEPIVEIGSQREGAEIVFYVRDNGVGFDMKYASKLFRVFQRLHRVEEFEGTGVGLAIVHRIIKRHGGRVWAESKVGEGARFCFALPVD